MLIFTWVQGYISGMNGVLLNLKSATFDLQAISAEQQWAYIVAYCRANPNAAIVAAVMDLASKRLMRASR
jgi:hypothetical protein